MFNQPRLLFYVALLLAYILPLENTDVVLIVHFLEHVNSLRLFLCITVIAGLIPIWVSF